MTFDKAAIILLCVSNLLSLWVNRHLSELVDEACELIKAMHGVNCQLVKLIGRNNNA
jgi:hypothetical protein